MSRPAPARTLSAFTLFSKLLNLRDAIAGLFRARRGEKHSAKLHVEAMEERVVPDGRPLPLPVIFAGAGVGEAPLVRAYDADTGNLRWSAAAFGSSFRGGVHVAAGDLTGDGIPDAVVAPGAGDPRVVVLDGNTGAQIGGPVGNFLAYAPSSTGGVYVAAADVDGDHRIDIVTAAQTPDGPRVKAFDGVDGHLIANFLVPGAAFRFGVTLAAADFTGDGRAEVVVGSAGLGDRWGFNLLAAAGGGRVETFDPLTGHLIAGPLGNFRPFGAGYWGGVFVGADALAGDVNGDGVPDLAVGTGPGPWAGVRVFSGKTGAVLRDIRPFGPRASGGTRVALAYVDDDARADIVVGTGVGPQAQVEVFSGATGARLAAPLGQYSPFGNSHGGVFVAATNDPTDPGMTLQFNGSMMAPTLVAGQGVQLSVQMYGMLIPPTVPTGTVTFTATDSNSVTTTLGTAALSAGGGTGNSVSAPLTVFLAAGSYTIGATYSGDSNYNSVSTSGPLTVNSLSSSAPAALAPGGPCKPDLVATPAGAGQARGGYSVSGVNSTTGSVTVSRTDLTSVALGDGWGVNWSWTSAGGYGDGVSGSGATQSEFAHLVQANNDDSVALVSSATTAHWFDLVGGSYVTRYGDPATLAHDTTNGLFVVTDGTGRVLTFYDFSFGTPTGRAGKLKKVTDADGQITEVTSWDTSGKPTEVQRTTGSGGSALTESFVYAYIASGTNAGLLDTVTQRTKIGTGSWSTVRSTDYTYYDGTTGPGLAGALKLAQVKDSSGTVIDTEYYRYYTSGTGTSGQMKYAFGADAYARLTAALGTSVDSLTDAQVDDYADKYIEYNSAGQATKVVDAAAGCSVCSGGQGEFTYTYSTNSATGGVIDANTWTYKAVETLPNGTTNTVYTNGFGEVMLSVVSDGTNTWRNYTQYDSSGRAVLVAGPTTVTGFSESNSDLVGFSSGNASYLSDSVGMVTAYTYATSTTATTSSAGDAAGYLASVSIKQGETGTAIPQSALSYIKNTVSSIDFFNLASQTVYRNDNGTGGQTTSYAYTYISGTNEIASVTTTLPAVTTGQNGSNSANTAVVVNDAFGRPVWAKNEGGFINYVEYDNLTGGVVKAITDVDTTQTSTFTNLPSGWSTPTGGGLHLTTSYEVDALGRTTKMTAPNGRIDYTVYNDANHEVRFYAGWDSTNNVATGPTVVTRVDQGNGYTETLTMSATPNVSSGRPTGTESIAKVQSLSRSYVNAVGQVIQTDAYFNLSGLTYSTSTSLGTEGVNFYRTRYEYDNTGAVKRVQTPEGTITRTVRDALGRVVSEWIGTDDTPTSGVWSPSNTTGTNLVMVREYQYDGGSVGDSNLTKVTEHPGGSAADRVTQTWYDWRDRAVAVKGGVETSESTSVNRPLAYYDFDNLGEVTKVRVYDADTVTPSITSGVPQPLSGSLLRAQTTTSYDELGRAYRSDTYSVDPSSGTVGSDTLYSLSWFDARGNVEKTLAPGGLVAKYTYDGAGRLTASYTTDGGGDSGYSDADDVTGDIVLEQVEYGYDASGNVLSVTTRQRFHDASGTGALGSPSSGIGARVSYAGYYYDLADRQTASVDVGTNAGSSWTRPGSVPSRSTTVLVSSTSYATDGVQDVTLTGGPTGGTFTLSFGGYTTSAIAYNASASTVDSALEALTSIGSGNVAVTSAPGGAGWEVRFTGTLAGKYQSAITGSGANLTGGTSPAVSVATVNAGGDAGLVAEVTDAAGRVSRSYSDAAGRTVRTIENFVDGVVSDTDDKSVGYSYNGAGMTALTAYLTGGGVQTTRYVFGVTQGSGSGIDSNDIVGATQWPDPTTGAASSGQQETTTVNALGETLTATDRNGSIHALAYDVLGRVVSDAVTTLASGVDGGVRRIETAYDGQGNAYLVTSYDAASSGNIVNQVQRAFNGLGQLTTEWQSHSGAVNTSTSPKVQYAWSEMPSGADHSRLTSVTYPDGYVLTYNYASGLDSSISRLSSLSDTSGSLEAYSYLGLATVVMRAHSQPNIDLSYVKRSGESNGDAGDQYIGLDRFGRVVDQRWLNPSTGTATDRFQYGYDQSSNRLYRDNLVNSAFGELYSYDALDQLSSFQRGTLNGTYTGLTGSASRSQDWDYDAVGNFDSVTTNGGSPQTRTANAQNEITSISGATTPTYDSNGNMTGDETGRQFVYDAWNRLVIVKNSGGTTLETFAYDGLNRRVSTTASSTTTDLYYSANWQVLAEKVSSNYTNRYVWSPVYVDAMVLRDRDTDANGTLDERLWVQQDANWNVTALVNGSGTVVERDVYDPYGGVTVLDASYGSRGTSSYGWDVLWQGMRYDSVSGSYKSRGRTDISPTLGRPFQPDPLRFGAGDGNFYRWEGNSPVVALDPSGLYKMPWDKDASWKLEGSLVGDILGVGPNAPKLPATVLTVSNTATTLLPFVPNLPMVRETWNPVYLLPGGTHAMQTINDIRWYHGTAGADLFSSTYLGLSRNTPFLRSGVAIIDMLLGESSSPGYVGTHEAKLDGWDYAGRIVLVGLEALGARFLLRSAFARPLPPPPAPTPSGTSTGSFNPQPASGTLPHIPATGNPTPGSSVNLGQHPSAAGSSHHPATPPAPPGLPPGSGTSTGHYPPVPPGSNWTPGAVPNPIPGGNPILLKDPATWAAEFPGHPYPPHWLPGPMGKPGNAWWPPQ